VLAGARAPGDAVGHGRLQASLGPDVLMRDVVARIGK
jgi:hypothetical protein